MTFTSFYQELIEKGVPIHPKWSFVFESLGNVGFSLLDQDYNLITFGEEVGLITVKNYGLKLRITGLITVKNWYRVNTD